MIDIDAHGPQPGDTLDGDYRIDGILGEGGFSTVYRATQTAVGRTVAIKWMNTDVVSPDGTGARTLDELVERFRREARIVARLDHPATVTLHDFGRTDSHDLYMVLEHVDGRPLTQLRGDQLAPNHVVALLEQALESLAEAHDHGVIHRDIKPGNLMVYEHRDRSDRIKILDFGIAKVLRAFDDETFRQLTGESSIIGTPRYIAPENATNRDPGPPTDLYSLGLVAYELLLGERAVPGHGDTYDLLDRHLSDDFQVHISRRPAVPDGLRGVINRMVRKSLDDRYATADAALEDLRALPDYGDAYGPTDEMSQPDAADSDRGTDPDIAETSTASLPDVPAYDDRVDLGPTDAPDRAASETPSSRKRPPSGPYHRKGGQHPEDRTAHERPMPPSARDGGTEQTSDECVEDRDETGPTRRASFPPGRTCDLPQDDARDDETEESEGADAADADGEGRSSLVVAAGIVLVAALVTVGMAFL
ncbi:MAG: serine/threonine protein kinase [Bradymonadaceae bacterium]